MLKDKKMDDRRSILIRDNELTAQINELKASELGKYLGRQELVMILNHSKIFSFSAGEILIQQGKEADGVYIILQGTVITEARIMGERRAKLDNVTAGNFIGEVSFIKKEPCATSAIAKNKVTCLLITYSYFELLANYFPEIRYKILKAIIEQVYARLKHMYDEVTALITHSDMASLSFLGRVIHSITQPKHLHASDVDKNHLQKKDLFQFFEQHELDQLFEHAVFLEASRNCILTHESEKEALCYVVIQGAVQSSIMKDNKIAKLSVIGPGCLFANIACIDKESPVAITFITCESVVLLKISESTLAFFQQHNPTLWYKLFNLICESLAALGKSINKLGIRLHIESYNNR